MNATRVRYALSADSTEIAYAVAGTGPPLLLLDNYLASSVGSRLLSLRLGSVYRALAEHRTMVMFDWRGAGSSATAHTFTLDSFIADVEAVVAAAGLSRFDLLGRASPTHIALEFAFRHGEQVRKLVLSGSYGVGAGPRQSPAMAPVAHLARTDWEAFRIAFAVMNNGWTQEARETFEDLGRHWTPESFEEFMTAVEQIDTTARATRVTCSTLVVVPANYPDATKRMARQLTASLPRGHMVEGPVPRSLEYVDAVEAFLGPWDEAAPTAPTPTIAGSLRTILFTDIEAHTAMMQRLGDAKGRDVLREHERISREALKAHGGTEVKTIGDSFMASFPSAQRAVECAIALQRAFEASDCAGERLRVRVGINAGEPIAEDDDLFGSSVILASRTKEKAAGGEIFVTDVVRQLVAGKGFTFADRGEMEMRGFEEPVRLYEVRWSSTDENG